MADMLQNNCSKIKFVVSEAQESDILIAPITLCDRQEDLASVKKILQRSSVKILFYISTDYRNSLVWAFLKVITMMSY